jgi:hypothetical protein
LVLALRQHTDRDAYFDASRFFLQTRFSIKRVISPVSLGDRIYCN